MPDSDISEFLEDRSRAELERIIAEAGSLLRRQEEEEERSILDEINALAAKIGKKAVLEEKATVRKSKRKNYPPTTRPPKYRNPDDAEETWHGRGPRPEWLKDLEDAGRKREEFLIGA